ADESLYGASTRLLANELGRYGLETTFVPSDDAAAVEAALRPNTRAVLVETISNPLMRVADLPRLGALCLERSITLIVDHTFAPTLAQPLAPGAMSVVPRL